MKLRWQWSVFMATVLAALGLAAWTSPASDLDSPPPPPSSWQVRDLGLLTPPTLGSRAALVMDADSGTVLYELNSHERLPPASLAKMVTALVALERAQLDTPIRATVYSMAQPTSIGLLPGDVLSLEDMLYGLMLKSGNDAALAIAEQLGEGRIYRFVGWMNDKVRSMGLRDTYFLNPHGLDVQGQYSSAYDIAFIGRAVMSNQVLAQIAATQWYQVRSSKQPWVFTNFNPLLYTYPGADGIKTGYEDRAGHTIAASATRNGHRVIAVVLNSETYADDARRLLDWAFGNFAWDLRPW